MNKKDQNRADLLSQTLSKLQNMDHETQMLVQQLADLQMELMNANESMLSERLGEAFSGMSKNREMMKGLLHDVEIEINRSQNE
jgi:hypothetical protein